MHCQAEIGVNLGSGVFVELMAPSLEPRKRALILEDVRWYFVEVGAKWSWLGEAACVGRGWRWPGGPGSLETKGLLHSLSGPRGEVESPRRAAGGGGGVFRISLVCRETNPGLEAPQCHADPG